ncbi:PfkB family carbohydrate kinase [Lacisediminihabitans sp. H27-G8]|uniref:PfkB family carbohydrate kinase n=1 Tax=Lacisediminihabitans sp. H27-G8 TaxID=3111909 RepID=UPI0038FC9EAC
MTTRLVSVGNVIVDVTLRIPELPERGGDVLARDTGSTPGGAFNTLVAAARQGLASAYGGAHGVGPHGDRVRSALSAEGISVLLDPSPDADTGFDIALVDDEGERTFVTVFGAEARLTARDLASISLGAGDLVHVSGYGLLERTNAHVLAPWVAGIGPGHTVLLDPGPLATTIPGEALATVAGRADWLSCNLREALSLTGAADAGAAATVLRETWSAVIIRLGPQGCLVVQDEARFVPGFAVEAVDTNGAGDAHTGAFLAGLASGETPPTAARRANACAAIAVTRRGPATAPTAAEVQRLLDRAG